MGYDMYRLTSEPNMEEEEPELDIDGDDEDHYFRLNIWGMGKARLFALWGSSNSTVDDLIKHIGKEKEIEERKDNEKWLVLMKHTTDFFMSLEGSIDKNLPDALRSFGSNFQYAPTLNCRLFAEAIKKGFDKLDVAIIRPDEDYEYIRLFSEWLDSSPNGVYVG